LLRARRLARDRFIVLLIECRQPGRRIERGGEAGIPVMQDEPHTHPRIFQARQQIPGLLHYPGLDRTLRSAQEPDAPGAMLNHGQDVDRRAVKQVGSEEVQRQYPLRLGAQELRPARTVPAGRRHEDRLPDRGGQRGCLPRPHARVRLGGGPHAARPITGIAAQGHGYLLVSSKGDVYAFNTPSRGSLRGTQIPEPIIGITAEGPGYLLTSAFGEIYAFDTTVRRLRHQRRVLIG
jgi:hypothetical protein